MTTIIYDGTYQGWLTAVFEIYEYKLCDVTFTVAHMPSSSLFGSSRLVNTDEAKATRVFNGLSSRLSAEGMKNLYYTFLSEVSRVEELMWRFVNYVFSSTVNIEDDLSNTAVWEIHSAARWVNRERHRMKAFVRFQLTKDGLYYAIIEPECNVLPLISKHFNDRYADQRWLIYDAKRRYGIYYDLQTVSQVELQFNHLSASSKSFELCDEREEFFQDMWRRYFDAVNIKARKNMRLHLQHMPKRYWKYLTEKIPDCK